MARQNYLSNAEISAFCAQLSMVLNAGMPTYYGISILCDEAPDEATRVLLEKIYEPMEQGVSLYGALKETNVFPPYVLNMIQLGEEAGRLDEVLKSLSRYYEREDTIRSSIRSSIVYPFILTILMVSVIIVMVAKVLPIFSQIYAELGSELTGAAKALMNISTAINQYIVIFAILFVVTLVTGIIVLRTDLGKILFQKQGLAVSIAASRFANCMFLALSSGLDTDTGLNLAHTLVNNPYMQHKIDVCKEAISHGDTFASALLKSDIFSKMYTSWIAIGSKTGSMDDVMQHISEAYQKETEERLSHYIAVLEPTLVIILCAFIGLILVSFLLPLLGIMSSIG